MNPQLQPTVEKVSWLSLVAETAGAEGATIARVELQAESAPESARVVLQVFDGGGRLVGSTFWYGHGTDLLHGTSVDIGCDGPGTEMIAWIDSELSQDQASDLVPPSYASSELLSPWVAIKLMLRSPTSEDLVAQAA